MSLGSEAKVRVVCDSRETRSGVIAVLRRRGVDVVQQVLEVGDYDLSDGVLVERKHVDDFIASMESGRLGEQIDALVEASRLPVLVVEGDVFGKRGKIPADARRAMIGWAVQFRHVWVVQSAGARDTARWLTTIARQVQQGASAPTRHPGKTHQSPASRQLTLLRVLPAVGEARAQTLLLHFGTALNAMNASHDQLRAVVGNASATVIRAFLDGGSCDGER